MDAEAEEGRRYRSLDELHAALRRVTSLHGFDVVIGNALTSPVAEVAQHDLVGCFESPWCQFCTVIARNYRQRWLANYPSDGA